MVIFKAIGFGSLAIFARQRAFSPSVDRFGAFAPVGIAVSCNGCVGVRWDRVADIQHGAFGGNRGLCGVVYIVLWVHYVALYLVNRSVGVKIAVFRTSRAIVITADVVYSNFTFYAYSLSRNKE